MEKDNQSDSMEPQEAEAHLPPPEQSSVSTILNGFGNGLMLGAVPFVLLKTGQQIFGKKLGIEEKVIERIGTFGSVIGCGLGTVFGMSEARQVENYRISISKEINRLSTQLDTANSKISALTRAIEAKDNTAEPAR